MSLFDFVKNKMKMSHIYQPVMIKTLIENDGSASVFNLAKELLIYDLAQIEYYSSVTNSMVGKVLRKHKIVDKIGDTYKLVNFENLTSDEKRVIIDECITKIEIYIEKRGALIWEHRRRNRRPIPGSIRFEVLKRAKQRCELCGISADLKGLEVDHIIPKNIGGKDSIENYQALCYTCNAQKKDLDNTDFRDWHSLFNNSEDNCIFCIAKNQKILFENNLAMAVFDNYPVTRYHSLIIPKRHVPQYFDLHQAETNATTQLISSVKDHLLSIDSSIEGFNIGINCGAVAGQTIQHCHIHLIPRRIGDVENPIGGIRNIIPGKGDYLKNAL